MEIWDLYNREGEETGQTWERTFGGYKQIPEGCYHMVVDILVQHVDGSFLLTKRDMRKDVYPGYWEASAGGAALKGEEPLEAAERELFEETGLTADSLELVDVSFKDSTHAMYYSYLAKVSCSKDSIVLQEGETTDYRWVDAKGLLDYAESADAMRNHVERYRGFINELEDEIGYDQ
jgi:8-oxo-dGTP pyrophosphatase MutT (NUDIX family)